ncbi:coiled-coil domain-containing protein 14 [Phyllobates terribilis]|uniref:coiled-coil domain-containing protein 14 n=1 Tax=Phyllobates terribilis TaxID=111132 RepID=UPI003CCAD84D
MGEEERLEDRGTEEERLEDRGTEEERLEDRGTEEERLEDRGTEEERREDRGTEEERREDRGTEEERREDRGTEEERREDRGTEEERREDRGTEEERREDRGTEEERREDLGNGGGETGGPGERRRRDGRTWGTEEERREDLGNGGGETGGPGNGGGETGGPGNGGGETGGPGNGGGETGGPGNGGGETGGPGNGGGETGGPGNGGGETGRDGRARGGGEMGGRGEGERREEGQLKPHKGSGIKGNVGSSTMKTKKTVVRRHATAAHVIKEKGSLRRTVAPGLCSAEAQRLRVTSPPLIVPSHHLEHVTTQMQQLNCVSSPVACAAPSAAPSAPGPEASARYNCRLPTSTPALSPQHPAHLRSASDADFHQTLPPGGITHFPSSMPASSAFAMAGNIQAPALHNAMVPTSYRAAHHSNVLDNYKSLIRDSDLLQCVAAHLAQLQQSEIHVQGQAAAYTGESECERGGLSTESDEDDTGAAPVRDISCQTSFSKHKTPEKTEKKIQTVKYLLGDIKSLVADRGDEEAKRLVTELEHRVSLLPAAVGDVNVHAEIALALQPLRSENAQLRRRLRILNQQLRERERGARSEEQNSEVTSLQSMNESLQKGLEAAQSERRELLTAMEAQREESRRAAQIIQEKDREMANVRKEVDEATGKMKSVQFKLEASEKEKQILGITLRQQDTEVVRLRELTRTLQAGMAKLLCDLGKDVPKAKPGGSLTRAALGSYERQLQSEEGPASTSILNYLKRLETDQVFTGTDPIYSDRPLLPPSGQVSCGNGAKADVSEDYRIIQAHVPNGDPQSACPAPSYSPRESKAQELGSESFYLTGTEPPDDTLYLPLVTSPCKYNATLRGMCTPPKVHSADRDLDGNNQIRRDSSKNPRVPEASHHLSHTSAPTSETLHHNHRLEASAPRIPRPSYPAPVLPQVRGDPPSERSGYEGKPDWSICSFSTFTSHDEQDFRNGLAALDANIAELQRTLQSGVRK